MLLAEAEVVLAAAGSDVNDAGPLRRLDVLPGDDRVGVAGGAGLMALM